MMRMAISCSVSKRMKTSLGAGRFRPAPSKFRTPRKRRPSPGPSPSNNNPNEARCGTAGSIRPCHNSSPSLQPLLGVILVRGVFFMRIFGSCVFLLFTAVSLAGQAQEGQTRSVVKADSRIEFHATSTFGKTVGVFRSWDADLKMPTDNFADASLVLEIDAASVQTGNGLKDKEAKGKNFFSVKENPKIRFVSKTVVPDADPSKLHRSAELTLRGITKPVSVAIILYPRENGLQHMEDRKSV